MERCVTSRTRHGCIHHACPSPSSRPLTSASIVTLTPGATRSFFFLPPIVISHRPLNEIFQTIERRSMNGTIPPNIYVSGNSPLNPASSRAHSFSSAPKKKDRGTRRFRREEPQGNGPGPTPARHREDSGRRESWPRGREETAHRYELARRPFASRIWNTPIPGSHLHRASGGPLPSGASLEKAGATQGRPKTFFPFFFFFNPESPGLATKLICGDGWFDSVVGISSFGYERVACVRCESLSHALA